MRSGRIASPRSTLLSIVTIFMMINCSPTFGGTINVSGSWTVIGDTGGFVNLVGDRGFTLGASAPGIESFVAPLVTRVFLPGQTIDLTAGGVDGSFSGAATLDGIPYPFLGSIGISVRPVLDMVFFGGSVIAPPLNVADIVALTNPVQFRGTFFTPAGNFGETLLASATATLVLEHDADCCWEFQRITYNLQPTPEPATLLLFGAAMAGLRLTAWRKRSGT